MTDQERIAKLRYGSWDHTIMRGPNPTGFCSDETLFVQETADRIERLVEDRNMAVRLLGAATQMQTETQDKLDKAVEALRDIIDTGGCFGTVSHMSNIDRIARVVLAELEGKE